MQFTVMHRTIMLTLMNAVMLTLMYSTAYINALNSIGHRCVYRNAKNINVYNSYSNAHINAQHSVMLTVMHSN